MMIRCPQYNRKYTWKSDDVDIDINDIDIDDCIISGEERLAIMKKED